MRAKKAKLPRSLASELLVCVRYVAEYTRLPSIDLVSVFAQNGIHNDGLFRESSEHLGRPMSE
jgi:hypothetical protein